MGVNYQGILTLEKVFLNFFKLHDWIIKIFSLDYIKINRRKIYFINVDSNLIKIRLKFDLIKTFDWLFHWVLRPTIRLFNLI